MARCGYVPAPLTDAEFANEIERYRRLYVQRYCDEVAASHQPEIIVSADYQRGIPCS